MCHFLHITNNCATTNRGTGYSGCTGHYSCLNTKRVNVLLAGSNSIKVTLPNISTISSTHVGILPYENLPDKVRIVQIFPDLQKCLMHLGQRCDARMEITLISDCIIVLDQKSNKKVLQGTREKNDGMWYLDLIDNPLFHKTIDNPSVHKANSVYECNKKRHRKVFIYSHVASSTRHMDENN